MCWPGVAIDASVLAPAVGIDRAVEAQIRRLVVGDNVTAGIGKHLGLALLHQGRIPTIIERNTLRRLEPARPVGEGGPAAKFGGDCAVDHGAKIIGK